MDHETLKRMEQAVLEELDESRMRDLQRDLAAHPEALERVRALSLLTRDLRATPRAVAPPDLADRVTGRLRAKADTRLRTVRRHACRHCAMLFGAAGLFYLILAGTVLLTLRGPGSITAVASGLSGQPLLALVSGLVLLALGGLLLPGGQAMLRPAMAGAVLHALASAANGLTLMAAGPPPVAMAGLAMAWTGLVAGAILADAARQSLGQLHAYQPLPTGA